MAGKIIQAQSATIGTAAGGYVTVPSASGYYKGAKVWLSKKTNYINYSNAFETATYWGKTQNGSVLPVYNGTVPGTPGLGVLGSSYTFPAGLVGGQFSAILASVALPIGTLSIYVSGPSGSGVFDLVNTASTPYGVHCAWTAGVWTRCSTAVTAPGGLLYMGSLPNYLGNTTVGGTIYIAAAQAETGALAPYIDNPGLAPADTASQRAVITEVNYLTNTMGLRFINDDKSATNNYGRSNVSAFALGGVISQEEQFVYSPNDTGL